MAQKGEYMNLDKLFQMQKALDERINKEHQLEGQDLLPKKILALQVELGELANEWRGFKFWSKDQEPRTNCEWDYTLDDEPIYRNLVLEEYVDCLHFILSIGLEVDIDTNSYFGQYTSRDVTSQFKYVFQDVSTLDKSICEDWSEDEVLESYSDLVLGFIGLGEMLGFTWEQIEQSYLEKNKVNHSRQTEGY